MVLNCDYDGDFIIVGSYVSYYRMLLVRSMIDLLTRKKMRGPFDTPNSKCSNMYTFFFIILMAKTSIGANMYNCLYTTSQSILDIRMRNSGLCVPHDVPTIEDANQVVAT